MKPTVHLICNAHLDPVWQWRWEEGASEAVATFRNAVEILDEHPDLIFCHNEAVLYRWVERLHPALFADILRLVRAGRWSIAGGWFIQPDVNLPGTESIIRHIAEGRRYFREKFGAAPRVAYNFDSFGHSAGLPQILRQAGYEMYVHMRPQSDELTLPADLYRWRGADGTVIPAYRITVGLYHTERDNIQDRLEAGTAMALELRRDVPVFWGLGNHGGGATRDALRVIERFAAGETRVRIIHSTPDAFWTAVRRTVETAPLFEGDLQRCFTGCYTSLSRVKRRARRSLGGMVQAEALAAAAWWLEDAPFPAEKLARAWRSHLFNDFHDVLTGSCVEPAESDALDLYGKAEAAARSIRLGAVAALTRGGEKIPDLPVTVAHSNPALVRAPVEFECMSDYRPFWKGEWHLRVFRADGREIPSQEEQPEALLPFHRWRRRLSFVDELPGVGIARYYVRAFEGTAAAPETGQEGGHARQGSGQERGHVPSVHVPIFRIDAKSGFVTSLKPEDGRELLAGPLFEPLVVDDPGDSWGSGVGRYSEIVGGFRPEGRPHILERGPVRTIVRSSSVFRKSRVVIDALTYRDWPAAEFRFRVDWNEERRRLKLRVPTRLGAGDILCEVPGAALARPADGEEHVHGRWLVIEGKSGNGPLALGIANSGQHGFDAEGGEVRLSVLRSAAYCHERGFELDGRPRRHWKLMDTGIHEFRLLAAAGAPDDVRAMMPGLADHLDSPPAAYPHLPAGRPEASTEIVSLAPMNVRLLACKPSWDGRSLILRIQECSGQASKARLVVAPKAGRTAGLAEETLPEGEARRAGILISIPLKPFAIRTVRIEPTGSWREVGLISEE